MAPVPQHRSSTVSCRAWLDMQRASGAACRTRNLLCGVGDEDTWLHVDTRAAELSPSGDLLAALRIPGVAPSPLLLIRRGGLLQDHGLLLGKYTTCSKERPRDAVGQGTAHRSNMPDHAGSGARGTIRGQAS